MLPRLDALDLEREALLPGLRAQLRERRRDAEGQKASHDQRVAQLTESHRVAEAEYDRLRGEVDHLQSHHSERPDDGYPSSLAIDGDWRKRLLQYGLRLLILLVLLSVEVPIYYETFLNLGDSPTLTFFLAIGAVIILVFGPHAYGRKFREWQADGRVPHGTVGWVFKPSAITVIPAIWLGLVGAVSYQRLRALTQDFTIVQSTGLEARIPALSSEIGFYPTLIIFVSLMIFTALIAFDLGRKMANPADRRLRELRQSRNEAERHVAALREEMATAKGTTARLSGQIEDIEGFLLGQYEQVLHRRYDHLEEIYTQAFMLAINEQLGGDISETDALYYARGILERHRASSGFH
jgi:hypothetical protein